MPYLQNQFVLDGMSAETDKQPDKIKCPKCGHEVQQDAGWLKVSSKVTCPVCRALVIVKPAETNESSNLQKSDKFA
jgi:DNA-directed RNA polymerase subunit RPC12/RpoP